MTYQIIAFDNEKINYYKENIIKSFDWNVDELIKSIDKEEKLFIIYLEKIMYHKSFILYNLEKNNIKYEIIDKNLIETKKYIYDYWMINKKEIIEINKTSLLVLLDLKGKKFGISIFKVNNKLKKLDVEIAYEKHDFISEEIEEQYLFLYIINKIKDIMSRSDLKNIIISKILLTGEVKESKWFEKKFQDNYPKKMITVLDIDIKEALEVYLDIKNNKILDPFNKSIIKYFKKEIILNEYIEEVDIRRSIQLVDKYERLPINKNILISPISSIGVRNIFNIEVDNNKFHKEIYFPFIYNFDELKFNLKIENEKIAKINLYLNKNIIDTWIIDWSVENGI